MKLSEFLRNTELKLPLHVIVRNISYAESDGYLELTIYSKLETDNGETIYKILAMSTCPPYTTQDVRWMSEKRCTNFILEKVLE